MPWRQQQRPSGIFLLVGVSTRSLAESAVASGFAVTAVDYFGDADQRRLCPVLGLKTDLGLKPAVKGLLEIAGKVSHREGRPGENGSRSPHLAGVVYAAGPENNPEGLQLWEQQGLLMGNNPATLRRVRDPWELQRVLRPMGVSLPPFYPAAEWDPDKVTGRWLIKPLASGGGHGIRPLERDRKGARAQLAALEDKSRFIIQQLVRGIPASATFIADGRQAFLLGTSRQLAGVASGAAGPFTYAGNIVPLSLPDNRDLAALEARLTAIAGYLTSAFGLKGLNTLDFIINGDTIRVLEVNPRWSASVELIEKWRQERLFPLHLAACGNNKAGSAATGPRLPHATKTSTSSYDRCFWGKAIVYAHRPLLVTAEYDLEELYRQGLRDIPVPGTVIAKGQALCTVLARAENPSSCWQKLQARAARARRVLGRPLPGYYQASKSGRALTTVMMG